MMSWKDEQYPRQSRSVHSASRTPDTRQSMLTLLMIRRHGVTSRRLPSNSRLPQSRILPDEVGGQEQELESLGAFTNISGERLFEQLEHRTCRAKLGCWKLDRSKHPLPVIISNHTSHNCAFDIHRRSVGVAIKEIDLVPAQLSKMLNAELFGNTSATPACQTDFQAPRFSVRVTFRHRFSCRAHLSPASISGHPMFLVLLLTIHDREDSPNSRHCPWQMLSCSSITYVPHPEMTPSLRLRSLPHCSSHDTRSVQPP